MLARIEGRFQWRVNVVNGCEGVINQARTGFNTTNVPDIEQL